MVDAHIFHCLSEFCGTVAWPIIRDQVSDQLYSEKKLHACGLSHAWLSSCLSDNWEPGVVYDY